MTFVTDVYATTTLARDAALRLMSPRGVTRIARPAAIADAESPRNSISAASFGRPVRAVHLSHHYVGMARSRLAGTCFCLCHDGADECGPLSSALRGTGGCN